MSPDNCRAVVLFIEPQAGVRVRVVAEVCNALRRAREACFPAQIPRAKHACKIVANPNLPRKATGANPSLHAVMLTGCTRCFIGKSPRLLGLREFIV
jgi:hypothetical protein